MGPKDTEKITVEDHGKVYLTSMLEVNVLEVGLTLLRWSMELYYLYLGGGHQSGGSGGHPPITEHLGIRLMEDTTEVLEDQVGIMEMVELVVLDSSAVVPTCHGWHLSSCHKR